MVLGKLARRISPASARAQHVTGIEAEPAHHGEAVRALLGSATERAVLVAPFIKTEAFEYVIGELNADCELVCVTRWLPRDVASGVSDLGILDVIEGRGNSQLRLLDDLHAKLYAADDTCLVGSANVTLAGLGLRPQANTELLVEVPRSDDAVTQLLELVLERSRPATRNEALQVAALARFVRADDLLEHREEVWLPSSMRPELAFDLYNDFDREQAQLTFSQQATLTDIARAGLPSGLGRDEFESRIHDLLASVPEVEEFLDSDEMQVLEPGNLELRFADLVKRNLIADPVEGWSALSKWLEAFFSELFTQVEGSTVVRKGTVE